MDDVPITYCPFYRCCDEKKCFCACGYKCGTWDTKQKEIEKRGFKNCHYLEGKNVKKHGYRTRRKTAAEKCKVNIDI